MRGILPAGWHGGDQYRTPEPYDAVQCPRGDRIRFRVPQGRHHDRIRARSVGQFEHLTILETAHEVVPHDPTVIDK